MIPRSRWLLPVVLSLLAVSILRQLFPADAAGRGQAWGVISLSISVAAWAGVSWWIALDLRRFERFTTRASRLPLAAPAAAVLALAVVIDAISPSVSDGVLSIVGSHILLTAHVSALLGMAATAVLASSNPRVALQRIALLCVSTALALVAVEAVFRIFLLHPIVPKSSGEFTSAVASSWPRPVAMAKAPGVVRILGLADSFGVYGGRRNYHYLLENELNAHAGARPHEVVNLAQVSFGLPEEYAILTRFGLRYMPDVVLHGVFVGNDLFVLDGELRSFLGVSARSAEGVSAFRPGSALARQWLVNYRVAVRDRRARERQRDAGELVGDLSRFGFLGAQRKSLEICRRSASSDTAGWERVTALLDRIREACAGAGARYVMVVHPERFQVELDLVEEIGRRYGLRPEDYDLQQPQDFLLEYCRERDVPCLDLLPSFRSGSTDGGLYLLDDPHYSDRGNRLAAEEVTRFLRATGI